MKKLFAVVLAIAIAVSCCAAGVNAGRTLYYDQYGDVNYDLNVDIFDVTEIQRALADMITLSDLCRELADYDHDGEVTVFDANYIQRRLADMAVPGGCGGELDNDVIIRNIYASYDSGKAMVGVPVTFTCEAFTNAPEVTYELKINDKVVQERTTGHELTYTFNKVGKYHIDIYVYTLYGWYREYSVFDYEVVEPYATEKPVIVQSYFDEIHPTDGQSKLTVNAIGGTGPYDYIFTITPVDNARIYGEEGDYRLETGQGLGGQYLIQDKEGTNVSYIPFGMLEPDAYYIIRMRAIDAMGVQSDTVEIRVQNAKYYY